MCYTDFNDNSRKSQLFTGGEMDCKQETIAEMVFLRAFSAVGTDDLTSGKLYSRQDSSERDSADKPRQQILSIYGAQHRQDHVSDMYP